MQKHVDRRRSPRIRVEAFATMETKGRFHANDQAFCTVQDVSFDGIGLRTGQPPHKGQHVVVRIAIDDVIHELHTTARRVVRRGRSNFYDVGLDWADCTAEQLAFLDAAIALLDQQPK
jgi:hypothetical protein